MIVGDAQTGNKRESHPFVWADGVMTDLTLALDASGDGWVIESVFDINDAGQIVGRAYRPAGGGGDHAVMLTPVPAE